MFNEYFINTAQNLLKDSGESKNEFQDYLKNSNKQSFFLKVDPEEVHKLLLKIDTKKSSDTFWNFPKLIKLSAEFIKGHLSSQRFLMNLLKMVLIQINLSQLWYTPFAKEIQV